MFGIATISRRLNRRIARRLSTWTRDYLRDAALADLGCAAVGVVVAAQTRFGSDVTTTYLALSLALPVLWIVALWLAGAYDVRFIGTGSDEYRKVLNAGVSLTAAVVGHELAVKAFDADTVAVTTCPEMNGVRLRSLAWDLEKTGTDLCVSPALMADPAAAVRLHDRRPVLFSQIRVGKDGHAPGMYRFRTMVVEAEEREAELLAKNDFEAESSSSSAKIRASPRWGRTCGAGPWTTWRSCSMCSPATCRWWGRSPHFPARRRSTPSMSGAGWRSSLA